MVEEEEQHTPGPQQARGIYGFALFIMMNLCTFFYFIWMLLPTHIIEQLPYEPPQQYWGLAVPIFLCTCLFLFAFCIYPAMHGLQDGKLDHSSAITDCHSLPRNYFEEQRATARAKAQLAMQQRNVQLGLNDQLSLSMSLKTEHLKLDTGFENKRHTWATKPISKQHVRPAGFSADFCKPVSPVFDMDLEDVCKLLYFTNSNNDQ